MRIYVIEKITEEAAEKFNNWDDVLADEENNTEIIEEFDTYEEAVAAFEAGNDGWGYDTDMYCVGIRN